MKRLVVLAGALLLGSSLGGLCSEPPQPLEKVNVLPLSLDDQFQFRKTKLFLNDPKFDKPTTDLMIQHERASSNFGAITSTDRLERRGHYFTLFWRAARRTDITVRLEYRQENLGSFVQARELAYDGVKGSVESKFAVTGDDYAQDGRIVAWRALLIENGKIVGLTQSFLWN
jgi:hypothetical protein